MFSLGLGPPNLFVCYSLNFLLQCGSLLSIYGCFQYNKLNRLRLSVRDVGTDTEQGPYMPLMCEESTSILRNKNASNPQEDGHTSGFRRICNFIFEILFQVNSFFAKLAYDWETGDWL